MTQMKTNFFIAIAMLTFFATASCKNEPQKSQTSAAENTSMMQHSSEQKSAMQSAVPKNLTTYEFDIKGMTCAVGCAAVIEKTLAKTEGVAKSKVDFNNKKGTFTFDTSKINEEQLIQKIEKIAGGKMYTVENVRKI